MQKGQAKLDSAKKKYRVPYIIGEDLDLILETDAKAREFDDMWKAGLSVPDIARAFKTDPDVIAVLVIDRRRKGCISDRPGGAWGNRMPFMQGESEPCV